MKWLTLILTLAIAVGAVVLGRTNLGKRERRAQEQIGESLAGGDRVVDFGIVLHTVVKDRAGEELIPGAPLLRIVKTQRFGGLFDTLTKTWVGPSRAPVVWFVSPEQERIALHAADEPEGIWMQGSMGAGKTTTGGIWLALRVIEHATHPLKGAGVTAPTDKRMEELRKTLFGPKGRDGERIGGMWPKAWFAWREGEQVCTMATGLQIDFRSTHIQSAAAGSPIQGQNWAFSLNDELQDYYDLDGDIQMRGRAAWKGRYQRFVTVTPKDDPGYRTFRDTAEKQVDENGQPLWFIQRVIGPHSPFLHDSYWAKRKAGMSPREWQRKGLGEDVASEMRIYYTWERADQQGRPLNLHPLPMRAVDVTAEVLAAAGFGTNYHLLVGHDPGAIVDYSLLLKAYRLPGKSRHAWFVVGEVMTSRTTAEQHAQELLKVLREKFSLHKIDLRGRPDALSPVALIHLDPQSDSQAASTRQTPVQTTFQNLGLHARWAAYSRTQQGRTVGSVKPGLVPKDSGIEMVVRLLCDANGERRLYVQCDDRGAPVAPEFVKAIETQELDAAGKAETARKKPGDTSHPVAACRYALWRLEAPRHEVEAAEVA